MKWSDHEDEWLIKKVEIGRNSAYGLGVKARRSTSAIQSRIVKLFGADSEQSRLYGTWDKPGPLTDWNETDYRHHIGPPEIAA